jgi:DNA mismatch repair protein MutL
LTEHKAVSQQLLFPRTLDLNPGKLQMFLELQEEFGHLGFDVSHFGGNSILINGLPPEVSETDEAAVIEGILEDITTSQSSATEVKHDNMALSMAKQAVRRYLSFSDASQARILVESLFSIENATLPHKNKPVAMKIGTEFIVDLFNRK